MVQVRPATGAETAAALAAERMGRQVEEKVLPERLPQIDRLLTRPEGDHVLILVPFARASNHGEMQIGRDLLTERFQTSAAGEAQRHAHPALDQEKPVIPPVDRPLEDSLARRFHLQATKTGNFPRKRQLQRVDPLVEPEQIDCEHVAQY